MNPVDVEQMLERLGKDWPERDSIVERVMQGLETMPVRPAKTIRWPTVRRILAIAASIAAIIVLWSVSRSGTSLYAQVRDAVHKARTFQMIITSPAAGEKPEERLLTVSYERGVGFCEEQPSEAAIGNSEGMWRYLKHARLAIRSKSAGIGELVDRALDSEAPAALKGGKHQRYAAGDQVVDGRPCRAYLVTSDQGQLQDSQRTILLLDNQSRITRITTEARAQDRWVVRLINDWKYDVPLDRSLFQASFPADVRVIDADAAFARYVDLARSVHREERQGLWYAIHHVERMAGGGLFLVSSVRGTEATLRQYPLTQRRLQPGMIFIDGPATNYRGPQEYRAPGYVVELASMDHEGINVSWWILLPLAGAADEPFDIGGGKVRVPVGISPTGGAYGKAHFLDAQGVLQNLTWDVELAAPQPETVPSLEAITRQVYADVAALEGVPFKFLNLGNRGLVVPYWSDLEKVTKAQFVETVADDVRWWQAGCPQDDRRYLELRKSPGPGK